MLLVFFDLFDCPADVVEWRGIFVLTTFLVAFEHIANSLLEFFEEFALGFWVVVHWPIRLSRLNFL